MSVVRGLISRALVGFTDWFQSDAGVLQAFVISTGAAAVELIWPGVDPNHFWYLFVCTYWSAFTCNALANSGRRDAEVLVAFFREIRDSERFEEEALAALAAYFDRHRRHPHRDEEDLPCEECGSGEDH